MQTHFFTHGRPPNQARGAPATPSTSSDDTFAIHDTGYDLVTNSDMDFLQQAEQDEMDADPDADDASDPDDIDEELRLQSIQSAQLFEERRARAESMGRGTPVSTPPLAHSPSTPAPSAPLPSEPPHGSAANSAEPSTCSTTRGSQRAGSAWTGKNLLALTQAVITRAPHVASDTIEKAERWKMVASDLSDTRTPSACEGKFRVLRAWKNDSTSRDARKMAEFLDQEQNIDISHTLRGLLERIKAEEDGKPGGKDDQRARQEADDLKDAQTNEMIHESMRLHPRHGNIRDRYRQRSLVVPPSRSGASSTSPPAPESSVARSEAAISPAVPTPSPLPQRRTRSPSPSEEPRKRRRRTALDVVVEEMRLTREENNTNARQLADITGTAVNHLGQMCTTLKCMVGQWQPSDNGHL